MLTPAVPWHSVATCLVHLRQTAPGVATLSRGCFVLLVGPDGSGKTTVSDALTSRADALGIAVSRAHYRPGFVGGRRDGSTGTETPHSQQPRRIWAGALKLDLVATDMTVGNLFRWRSQRHSGLLIVERGWWDMAVDPIRYRLNPWLGRLVRLLGPLIPRADLVVLLVGAPVEIDSRKREIGVGEVTRQLALWEELASQAGRKTIRIDTVLHKGEDVADVILDAAFGDHSAPTDPVRRVPLTPSRLNLLSSGRCGPATRIYKPFHPIRRPMKQVGFAAARHGLTRREFAPFDVQELCRSAPGDGWLRHDAVLASRSLGHRDLLPRQAVHGRQGRFSGRPATRDRSGNLERPAECRVGKHKSCGHTLVG
jgi:hypothetical protein